MGILELTPSIRADTEAFNKALKELGWSKDQYHRKIKRLGISLSDKTSTKNFLNDALKKIGSTFRYKNIMQAPIKIATETGMGGVEPGRVLLLRRRLCRRLRLCRLAWLPWHLGSGYPCRCSVGLDRNDF